MQDLKHWVDKIWMNDAELQREFLKVLISDVRHVADSKIQKEDLEMFEKLGMFYIPDDDYLKVSIGEEATRYSYGIYRYGLCTIAERVAIPMWTPSGQVVGFIGYSNSGTESTVEIEYDHQVREEFAETDVFSDGRGVSGQVSTDDYQSELIAATGKQGGGVMKYLYPPTYVVSKRSYVFCHPDWMKKALVDGYICITDGIFDAIRLNQIGVNALSICGSMLTDWHKMYLRMFDRVVIVYDNDNAGVKLAQKCCAQMKNCYRFSFTGCKDIDDFLKTPENVVRFKRALMDLIENGYEQGVLKSVTTPGIGMSRFNPAIWEDEPDSLEENSSSDHESFDRFSDGDSVKTKKEKSKVSEIIIEETEWQKEQGWSRHTQEIGKEARDKMARVNRLNFLMVDVDTDDHAKSNNPEDKMLKEAIEETTRRAIRRSKKIPNRDLNRKSSFLSRIGESSDGKLK